MNVDIRVLAPHEGALLARVAADVFDGPIEEQWATEFLADARHHIAIALDDGLVVGMATGVHYVHPDKPAELWINEVGVAPTHEGRGIGRRMLGALLDHAAALGCTEAWVLTEQSNVAARRMYMGAGGLEVTERPVMFTFALEPADGDAPS